MGTIYTLTGPVQAKDLGAILPHEHLPLFAQASDNESFDKSAWPVLKSWFEPLLDELARTPFRTMVEATPIALGRDIALWTELVKGRGIHVVPATGFYIDARQPEWAKEKSAEEIADFMVHEIEHGILGSGVRAGIIKIAPDAKSGQSRKVCRAAAIASRRTNARITTHSVNCNRESFDLLTGFGALPESVYIGHADFAEFDENESICKRGGNLIFTVWGVDHMIPLDGPYKRFAKLVKKGYVRHVLASVDFAVLLDSPARPYFFQWSFAGTDRRTFTYLPRVVIPRLKKDYRLSQEQLRIITRDNCVRMLDFRG